MSSMQASRPAAAGDTMLAASRQVWLAGLGAAVVTREWAGREAGSMFRTLVREGTLIESRAMRFVGDRVETSVTRANALWRQARASLQSAVRSYADGAVTLVRETLPRSLPKVELPAMLRKDEPASTRVAHAKRATAKRRVAKSPAKAAKAAARSRAAKAGATKRIAGRTTRRASAR